MLKKGIFSGGEEVVALEKNLSEFLKSEFAIACSNGTDALEIALRALGIGEGDEVIVPVLTWVSTVEVILLVGAKPVYVDTDTSGLIDLTHLERVFTPKTKAIIPVHLYGKMVKMSSLVSWAKQKNIRVIEDNAQGFGAAQEGTAAGCWGDIGCYSFYPTKNFGALGEAGAITTKDENLANKVRMLINHGQSKRDHHEIIGKNARIDSLQAGFLNIKLSYFSEWRDKRKRLAAIYLKKLKDVGDLILPESIIKPDHNAHLFVIQTASRDKLKMYLLERGIQTAVHYPYIVPKMKPYYQKNTFVVAEKMTQTVLSLPLNPFLEEKDLETIISRIIEFYQITS